MKILKTRLSVLSLAVAAAFVCEPRAAHAGFLFEPYAGYELGTLDIKYGGLADGTSNTTEFNGAVVGGRMGLNLPFVFAAFDYGMSMSAKYKVTAETSTPANIGTTGDFSRKTMSVVAGVKLPFVRIYGGYGFQNDFKITDSVGENSLNGTLVKAGASFKALPLVAINLEYNQHTFNKATIPPGAEFTIGSGQAIKEATGSSYMLSLSAPLNL